MAAQVVRAQHQALVVPLPNTVAALAVVATAVLVASVLMAAVRVTLLLQMLPQGQLIQAAAVVAVDMTLNCQAQAGQA